MKRSNKIRKIRSSNPRRTKMLNKKTKVSRLILKKLKKKAKKWKSLRSQEVKNSKS